MSPKPVVMVFSGADQHLMWQGMQKMINEAEEHRQALLKGMQETEPDANTRSICEYYGKRIQLCRSIQEKLPRLAHFVTDKVQDA